jgi:hypothetical protein
LRERVRKTEQDVKVWINIKLLLLSSLKMYDAYGRK